MKRALMCLALIVCGAAAQAGVISVGLDYVETNYDAGMLTMHDDGLIVVLTNDDNTQDAIVGATFNLTTSLSSGMEFLGGTFELTNSDATIDYLSGDVVSIVFDYSESTGTLSGMGQAEVLLENLDGDLLGPAEIVTITFNLPGVVDFCESFQGDSKVNLLVPEPASMAILGLGAFFLRKRKK